MLKRLNKKEIVAKWDMIKVAIEKALPDIASKNPNRMEQIYNNLMIGTMHCWAVYRKVEREDALIGIGTTTFTYDLCSGSKLLLGYTAYTFGNATDEEWMEGYQELLEFAKENKCERVCAYTNVPRMFDINKLSDGYAVLYITSPPLMNFSSEVEKEE